MDFILTLGAGVFFPYSVYVQHCLKSLVLSECEETAYHLLPVLNVSSVTQCWQCGRREMIRILRTQNLFAHPPVTYPLVCQGCLRERSDHLCSSHRNSGKCLVSWHCGMWKLSENVNLRKGPIKTGRLRFNRCIVPDFICKLIPNSTNVYTEYRWYDICLPAELRHTLQYVF